MYCYIKSAVYISIFEMGFSGELNIIGDPAGGFPHMNGNTCSIDDVIKWKHFPRYGPFARGIHRSPVNSSHKGQWHGALMFSLISARINGWVNNGETGDLRRTHVHYDVTIMIVGYRIFAPKVTKLSELLCSYVLSCHAVIKSYITESSRIPQMKRRWSYDKCQFVLTP